MMTSKEYGAAMIARGKVKGTACPVISRWAGSVEDTHWTAWVKYWTAVGAHATLKLIEDRKSWTVPTPYPWEFDVEYNG